jgi:hypothetical protein
MFLVSGTWSDPAFNPIPSIPVINAGVIKDAPYEGHYRHYNKCAFTAAMAYALNRRTEWDLLVLSDTDCLFGDIDLDSLIKEFHGRPEILMGAATNCSAGCNPESPFTIWKHDGAVRLLHYRQCPNLLDMEEERKWVWDIEMAYIYRRGRWWNPWPEVPCVEHKGWDSEQKFWDEMLAWPIILKPTQLLAQRWIAQNSCKTKPYKP